MGMGGMSLGRRAINELRNFFLANTRCEGGWQADRFIETLQAPQALGGFLVAILVLSPEAMGAAKAAIANKLQRTVNIALGSALATIGMTIPAVLAVSLFTGRAIELGLDPVDIVLLILTLLVWAVNFGAGRANILQGALHLILFISYIILIFD